MATTKDKTTTDKTRFMTLSEQMEALGFKTSAFYSKGGVTGLKLDLTTAERLVEVLKKTTKR